MNSKQNVPTYFVPVVISILHLNKCGVYFLFRVCLRTDDKMYRYLFVILITYKKAFISHWFNNRY